MKLYTPINPHVLFCKLKIICFNFWEDDDGRSGKDCHILWCLLIPKLPHCSWWWKKINFILSNEAYRRLTWKELLGFPFTLNDHAYMYAIMPYHFARSKSCEKFSTIINFLPTSWPIASNLWYEKGILVYESFTLNFQVLNFFRALCANWQ